MNKMVMAVIPRDEAEHVLDALINAGYSATFMETKGGMPVSYTHLTLPTTPYV